jgi:hypothetical protein
VLVLCQNLVIKKKIIIVAIDLTSRWIETRALVDKSEKSIAKFLIEEIFLRHGAPNEIVSDQGRELIGKIVKRICQIFESRKAFTSAYNPKANGTTERVNQTLVVKLCKLCNER